MYAIVVTVRVDSAADPQAMLSGLESNVIPRVRSAPGAIAGHWMAPAEGQGRQGEGMSVVFFETRENAEAAAASVPEHPAPGVDRLSVTVYERFTGF